MGGETFRVIDYMPFGIPRANYKPSSRGGYPALRFYIEGKAGRFAEWIEIQKGRQTETKNLGPAQITLTTNLSYLPSSKKELVLYIKEESLFYSSGSKKKTIHKGKPFPTGWMDFQFRLIEFFPKAKKTFVFSKKKQPSRNTLPAIKVSWKGENIWAGRNSYIRFYKENRVYAFGYLNKRKELGFSLRLLDFRKTNYQGSGKVKTYESLVETPGGKALISMNEPLKFRGYTFYQSGFEEVKKGEPQISILSVNQDPGRPLKYGGGITLVTGVVLLFISPENPPFRDYEEAARINQGVSPLTAPILGCLR